MHRGHKGNALHEVTVGAELALGKRRPRCHKCPFQCWLSSLLLCRLGFPVRALGIVLGVRVQSPSVKAEDSSLFLGRWSGGRGEEKRAGGTRQGVQEPCSLRKEGPASPSKRPRPLPSERGASGFLPGGWHAGGHPQTRAGRRSAGPAAAPRWKQGNQVHEG